MTGTTRLLCEVLAQHGQKLTHLRRPDGGFVSWMNNPQIQDRAALVWDEDQIVGWAVARWNPNQKHAWRRKYGKRVWTCVQESPRWMVGWFVDPVYRHQGMMYQLAEIVLTPDLQNIWVQPWDIAVTKACTRVGWSCKNPGTLSEDGKIKTFGDWIYPT